MRVTSRVTGESSLTFVFVIAPTLFPAPLPLPLPPPLSLFVGVCSFRDVIPFTWDGWADGWNESMMGAISSLALLLACQDHYTAMQPGLQRMVLRLEELVQRIDGERTKKKKKKKKGTSCCIVPF